ncbi:MAG: putative ribosomal N-acetyltransferase YdaF [bacterium ADurb.Bin374]|nr:MAG: putative ribosomal N-acetyltransferase YdaF [bacterium ADurb.Bin374]
MLLLMVKRSSVGMHFGQWMPPGRRLYGKRILLARLSARQAPALGRLLEANRRWLDPWMPTLPEGFSEADVRRSIFLENQEAKRGTRLDLGIFLREPAIDDPSPGDAGKHPRRDSCGPLVGRIALHTVQWGIIRSAGVGYWIDERHAGKGMMTEALATLISFAFEEVRLHRIWAGIQPKNLRSKHLVERLGFTREGLHRRELFIAGSWQDQIQYAMLEEEYDSLAETWLARNWLGT